MKKKDLTLNDLANRFGYGLRVGSQRTITWELATTFHALRVCGCLSTHELTFVYEQVLANGNHVFKTFRLRPTCKGFTIRRVN